MSTDTAVRAGLYCRLSVEDEQERKGGRTVSDSIDTQKILLADYCKQHGFIIVDYYIDDGVTGTTFARPGFQRMIRDIESQTINAVLCKDLSRIGRSHVVETYLEDYFPEKDVRFIAVTDNIDSAMGEYDLSVSIRTLLNSEYPKDISRKTKKAKQARAKNGMYIGSKAPFGYRKDPQNKNHLILDQEAAGTVRYIFDLALQGMGYRTIARRLSDEAILTPAAYSQMRGNPGAQSKQIQSGMEYAWAETSVQAILKNPAYCGMCAQGRRGNRKMHGKQYKKPQDEWIIVRNTHEAIVTESEWEQIQSESATHHRACKNGTPALFSGLLKCADCGCSLSYDRVERKTLPNTGKYRCTKYLRYRDSICSPHTIMEDKLAEAVLADIQAHAQTAFRDTDSFVAQMLDAQAKRERRGAQCAEDTYKKDVARRDELKLIFKSLLEKNAIGKLSDEDYNEFMKGYISERDSVDHRIEEYEASRAKHESARDRAAEFAALICEFKNISTLDSRVINALIDKIVVHDKEKDEHGKPVQRIEIFYKFVGEI